MEKHKSGFVAIIGKPNAGKSTLLNVFLGQKLVITTSRPQTTRHRILGILDEENYQVIFSDTPGVIKASYLLQRSMMKSVDRALEDADLILLLLDVNEEFPESEMLSSVKKTGIPVVLAINKMDEANESKLAEREREIRQIIEVKETVYISALHRRNTENLLMTIISLLPENPPWFEKGSLSDRNERFFVSEIIREKLFELLDEELPYNCEVQVLAFEEEEGLAKISAEIHVGKKSQKGMIIGKGGSMIKEIGTRARKDIEILLDRKVFLELHVRVTEGWNEDAGRLKGFGYE